VVFFDKAEINNSQTEWQGWDDWKAVAVSAAMVSMDNK
jgi:hypothetical protein